MTSVPSAPAAPAPKSGPRHARTRTPKSTEPFRLGNRPPLTGIRALALFAVLAYHSNFSTAPGAWVSLQIFFVLSGFLITAMLSSEAQRTGKVSLKSFYARRSVRLFPPLLLTVALLGLYASFVSVVDAAHRIWGDSMAALFYYYDYREAFGKGAAFGFLAQCWSLSVEEQFYILWSILVVVAVAVHRRRLAYVFAIIGMVLSTADRLWLTFRDPHFTHATFERAYYSFDSRADALFLGCLLGLMATDGLFSNWRRWAQLTLGAAALVGSAFLVWLVFQAPLWQERLLVWWMPLSTLASATLMVYFVICPKGWGSKFAGLGVLVFIGDLSYTIYLLHWPVYLAIGEGTFHLSYWPTELIRLAVIFGSATASWYLMERPLMRWRQRAAAKAAGET